MTTFFTSDLHLGHVNIIRFCQRPFADVEEMNAALIANWNSVVGPEDEVWVVGDFCHRSPKAAKNYLDRLMGTKHLVVGNHDSDDTKRAGWASVQPYAELSVDHRRVVLSHYGMRVWNGMRRHSLMLYGHSHGRLPGYKLPGGDGGTLDVGVDAWGYTPVRISDILRRIKTLEPMPEGDHHYRVEEDD